MHACMPRTQRNATPLQCISCVCPATSPSSSGKHVLFGRIVEGEEVLAMIEKVPVVAAENGKPAVDVVVANCGVLQ